MGLIRKQYISPKQLWRVVLPALSVALGLSMLYTNWALLVISVIIAVNVFIIFKYPVWGLLAYPVVFLYRPGEVYSPLAVLHIELWSAGVKMIGLTGSMYTIVARIQRKSGELVTAGVRGKAIPTWNV